MKINWYVALKRLTENKAFSQNTPPNNIEKLLIQLNGTQIKYRKNVPKMTDSKKGSICTVKIWPVNVTTNHFYPLRCFLRCFYGCQYSH